MGQAVVTPWGWWKVVQERPRYKAKVLHVKPFHRTSLQKHALRQERFIVVTGTGLVTNRRQTFEVKLGDVVHVAKNAWHRIAGLPGRGVTILEIQEGQCQEADITRKADDYGRT